MVSKSNKNDVLNILGKPSLISLFDNNSWIFIQTEKINQSIFKLGKSKITRNNVLEIKFNNKGIVNNLKFYALNDMNDLNVVKDITVSEYENTGSIGKLFKSIEQKINSPIKKRTRN